MLGFVAWGNCPKFHQKFDSALLCRVVVTKRRNMKTGKYSFKREIIVLHFGAMMYLSLPSPILRKSGGLVVQVSFKSVARFTVIRQMAPRIPSGLSAAMENE